MKALTLLLGARSLVTAASAARRAPVPEGPFLPLASTPETAQAWRMWAESGDVERAAAPARELVPTHRFPAAHRGSL